MNISEGFPSSLLGEPPGLPESASLICAATTQILVFLANGCERSKGAMKQ
jgi:hypothetical protein